MRAIALAKGGHAEADWEDAWAVDGEARAIRFAVADGATESSFAGDWARRLTARWTASPLLEAEPEALGSWLAPVQVAWRSGLDLSRLPWYAAEKALQGAFAALLGLELLPGRGDPGHGSWAAFALGDCCLFQLVPSEDGMGRLAAAFPIESAEGFSNRPLLLASRADRNERVWAGARFASGSYGPLDRFILASDAIACWLLRGDADDDRFAQLLTCPTADSIAELVGVERAAGRLRNDDVTIVIVECGDLAPAEPESAGQPAIDAEPPEAEAAEPVAGAPAA